jgi:CheY-like chemotaxis protein
VRCLFEASLRTQGIQKADARDTERRDAVIARAKRLGRQIEILVVDDEEVYADGIRAQIAEDRELSSCVKQTIAATPVRALELCEAQSFDLVITDVDLGRNEISGFDLARSIRRLQPNARTCVHSNRSCPDDYRNAVEAGADAFLPKPMSTQHLIGLLAGTGIVCSVGPAGRRS